MVMAQEKVFVEKRGNISLTMISMQIVSIEEINQI